MSGPSIRRAGLTVVLFTVGGKVLGLVREMVVAATYGTSHVVDVYLAGITVPTVIGTILSQALPNAFVPIFSGDAQMRHRGKAYAWVLLGCLGVVSVVLWFLAIPVSAMTSSGFAPAQRAAAVVIVRIA
ncbi:MAG TPA: hypothetical protein VM118_12365, partial [Acidobacteriota bacterium]|nr:hypothetical protein [Acidobacteriota bacterium]